MGRKKRSYYTGLQKVELLKRHLVGGEAVSAICESEQLNPTVFYDWQRKFFENGAKAFEKESERDERKLEERNEALEARLKDRDEVIAELLTEHLALKKSLGES
jgi:transposase-like protein